MNATSQGIVGNATTSGENGIDGSLAIDASQNVSVDFIHIHPHHQPPSPAVAVAIFYAILVITSRIDSMKKFRFGLLVVLMLCALAAHYDPGTVGTVLVEETA
jgi:hypothetical protein